MKTYTIITHGDDVLLAVAPTTDQAIKTALEESTNITPEGLNEDDLTVIENVVLTDDDDEMEGETVWRAGGGFSVYLPDENGREYAYGVKVA